MVRVAADDRARRRPRARRSLSSSSTMRTWQLVHRLAARADLAHGVLGAQRAHDGRPLGQTVGLDDRHPGQQALALLDHRDRHRLGAAVDVLHARQVVLRQLGAVDHLLEHRGDQQRPRRLLSLDEGEELRHVEPAARVQDHRAASPQRREGEVVHARGPAERRHAQVPLAGVDVEVAQLGEVAPHERRDGVRRPLGQSRWCRWCTGGARDRSAGCRPRGRPPARRHGRRRSRRRRR